MGNRMKLNLGCGSQVIDGWINVDNSLGARLGKLFLFGPIIRKLGIFNIPWDNRIYLHDLTKKMPWGDSEIDIVYSSHTLEHLSREEGRKFLQECHRMLVPGGIIRILVPDLSFYIEEYQAGNIQADEFLGRLGVLYGTHRNPIKNKLMKYFQFPHKCMYDTKSLVDLLNVIGFKAKAKKALESDINDISEIELVDRTVNAVIVEGKKIVA